MLDLVFINDQAPALNADNMNRIVNEINKTDAKANDLQSEIATLVIEKGGSIVQANPEEIPPEAEELNRLRINDKVYNISTESLNARITELDEKIDTDVSQLQDSIDAKVTQLTFETGIDIGDWEAVIDPDEPVIYERYMNYHDAVAKLSQQIDIMGNRTDALKTSLNYRKVGEADGQNVIALPSSFKELYVIISNGTSGVRFSTVIPFDEITSTSKKYNLGGYYYSSSNYGYAEADVNKSQIKVNYLVDSGSVKTTTAHIIVYVKE